MYILLKDLKHSARMFLQTPGFTLAALFALGLGIAANTAIFSVLNTVLLKPFAYVDPERIVMFQNTVQQGGFGGTASPIEFNWWRQETGVMQDISAYDFASANLTGEAVPQQIQTMRVSANFFTLSGGSPKYGRTFTPEDDRPNAAKTVVLGYSFWQRHFGSDPHVIGSRITISGELYEIVGVLDPSLKGGQVSELMLGNGDIEIGDPPDVYVPFQLDPNSAEHGHYFNVAGRLKTGVTLGVANARLQASFSEYAHKWPDDVFGKVGFRVRPLQDAIVGGVRHSLIILLGAVSLVMLIACANVTNLLLARTISRKREMAIRAAVGAGRWRMIRQLLTESIMLSLAGGALGLVAGYAGIHVLLSLSPGNLPRIGPGGSNVSLDWRVFAYTLGLSILTGIAFGLVPALQSSKTDLSTSLKESSNRSGTGLRHNKAQALLVTTETALALVLLVGAGLLIRTFIAVRQVNPGFSAHNVLTMRMSLTGPPFENPANAIKVIRDGIRRIRAIPGVDAAGVTCCVPLEDVFRLRFQIAGRSEGLVSEWPAVGTHVSAEYLEVFKIPVVRGRTFTEKDESGPPVAIINQILAKQFWPNGDPLNDQIIIDQRPRQIVGVVGDVHVRALDRDPLPNIYLPSAGGSGSWVWAIRTRVAPMSLSSAIQAELREASEGLPVARIRTMDEILSRSTGTQSFNMLVLAIFACSALLLAAIGIYGLMAYSIAQRTQEIGIRMALGAESRHIRSMVMFQGLRPTLTGVICGLAAASGLTRLVTGILFGVKPSDPFVFLVVPVLLIGVAATAVWLPARRAGRLDPIRAMRYE